MDTWICNTRHFDPTWFKKPTDILEKLKARAVAKGPIRIGPKGWTQPDPSAP